MDELPIFISYRQADGMELARWLHNALLGRTIFASEGTLDVPKTISVYFDQATLPVEDWQEHLVHRLSRACAIVVICSPSTATEFLNDIFYFEIRWWIANRSQIPPILITPCGQQWIPLPLKERWPKAQTINLSLRNPITNDILNDQNILDAHTERIVAGIAIRARGEDPKSEANTLPAEYETSAGLVNLPGLYTWEKDKHGRYVRCNENYARAAGFDSPQAMIGKTDNEMPWRSLADFFRRGDQQVMNAESPARLHVQEKEIMVDRVADILVTENQLLTKDGVCVGVTGYFLDITGKELVAVKGQDSPDGDFNLGPEFGNVTFSNVEASVFKGMLRKMSSESIAKVLKITKAEVDSHMIAVMRKLQCQTIGDVITTSIRAGLPISLFGLD